MAKRRQVNKRTKTIKVYEATALLIDQIVKRSPPNTTYADVVEQWAIDEYPKSYKAVETASENIGSALSEDEQEKQSKQQKKSDS